MATTYNQVVDGLEALTVTGVTRKYTSGPPASLSSADLPAQFVLMPSGEEDPAAVGTGSEWPRMAADLVIATEAVGQNTMAANYDALVDQCDNLVTALRGLDLGKVRPSWSIRLAIVTVARVEYWAVVARVEVQG